MTVAPTVISTVLVLGAALVLAYVRMSEDFDLLADLVLTFVAFGNGALFVGVRAGYSALVVAQIALDAGAGVWLRGRMAAGGRSR